MVDGQAMWGTGDRGWKDRATRTSCVHESDVRGSAVPVVSAAVVAARASCTEITSSWSISMLSSLSVSGSTSVWRLVSVLVVNHRKVLGRCALVLVRMVSRCGSDGVQNCLDVVSS